jgi:hypothetical protein
VFWTYNLPAKVGREPLAVLASCFAIEDNTRVGLCTASLPYGDLILTIHLRDNQMTSLATLYDQSVANLRRWER